MAAITRTAPLRRTTHLPAPAPAPQLRLIIGGADPRSRTRRLDAAVYRRRRLVALAVAFTVVALLSAAGSALLSAVARPSAPGEIGSSSRPGATYVVQPGDTLWSVARDLQPTGDVRPLVHDLAGANGGTMLRPGDRLVVP